MINNKRLIKTLTCLLKIKSENPPGDERAIADFVKQKLRAAGLEVKIYEFAKNRVNVVAVLKNQKRHKSLLLSPHLDTVPTGRNWKYPPFSAQIYKGRIYGRGATDCKGNLACAIETIESIVEDKIKLNYKLIFAATADEEAGSQLGLIPLLEKNILKADAAVILDSDAFNIVIAQKGLIHFKIKLQGLKAHGAYPDSGINAIELAAKIINDFKNYKFKVKAHPLLKPPTINIGTIIGGDKVNMVADWCEFEVDLRFLPQMKTENILKVIKGIIRRHASKFKIDISSIQQPYEIGAQHPLVKTLMESYRTSGIRPNLSGSEGATVITFFKKKNIPAVAVGFGAKAQAHATDEFANISDLYKGAKVLEAFIKNFNSHFRLLQ